MKVWVVNTPDGPFEMEERTVPTPAEGQVLLRVAASGVNPLDTKIRSGMAAHAKHPFPAVLGIDVAGTVEAIGPGVHGWKLGDEVYGMTGGVAGLQGSLAEFQAVDAALIARKPVNLSMVEAAALPLATITAWEGLVDRARIQPNQSVLVQGGAGGVGHIAVQLAVAFGAVVHATVSPDKATIVEDYGARPVNYVAQTYEQYVSESPQGRGWDVVYDTVGGAVLDASLNVVKKYTGHVVSCLGWGNHSLAALSFRGATYSGVFTLLPLLSGEGRRHHGEILQAATGLVEAGKVRPLLHQAAFGPDYLASAHQAVVQGTLGKVVVQISN